MVGLTKAYGRDVRALTDLDLTVERGEVFGYLGPNGAGKSTTIRLLLGLIHPSSGRASILGRDARTAGVAARRDVGYLPGDLRLGDRLTGREQLDSLARLRGGVDAPTRDALCARLQVDLDRPIRQLSKGNRQKIGLMLAFAHEPELVVLDEPTSGLDPLVQEKFHELLREMADDGRTILLSSHVLDEVQRVADRITVIREGRVVVTDTIAALQAKVPRRVRFEFQEEVDPQRFDGLVGVDVVESGPHHVVLKVVGPVDAVVKAAAGLTTTDLLASPADLEELFLGFYSGDSDGR